MRKSEIEKLYPSITVNGVIYSPKFRCSNRVPIKDGDVIVDYDIVNFELEMTAKEVYETKGIPSLPIIPSPEPPKEDGFSELQKELVETNQFITDQEINHIILEQQVTDLELLVLEMQLEK